MKKNPPGAQFEILVDGKPQSYGDVKDVAIASAELIKSHNPLSDVAVRDMETGEITLVSYKPGIILWRSPCARPALATASTRTASTTACSAASGVSAGYTKTAAALRISDGSGRCTLPADRRPNATQIRWRRWKRPRRSSRRVGSNGRLGRRWKRCRTNHDKF